MSVQQGRWLLVAVSLGLVFCTLGAAPLSGPDPSLALDPPVNNEGLVLGDIYTVRAEHEGAREKYSGELVKITSEWLVLHQVHESRSAHAVPLLSMLPYVGRMFRSAAIGRVDEFLWVRRELATAEKHSPADHHDDHAGHEPPEGDLPSSHVMCTVQYALKGKLASRTGSISSATDDSLTLAIPEQATINIPVPVLGNLPLIGHHMYTTQHETHFTKERLPQADILCIRMPNYEHKHAEGEEHEH